MSIAALTARDGAPAIVTDDLAASFAQDCDGSRSEAWFDLGGRRVRLRFGSSRMLPLLESFAHLLTDEQESADLTVWLWDSPRGSSLTLPAADPRAPRGTRMVWADDQLRACYQPGQDTLSVLSAEGTQAWFWCADARALPYWEHAAPLRLILSWWLAAQGANLVHGAAVGRPEGGALIVGRGGSGKSTTALLSLLGGLVYASDDYVVVEREYRGQGPFIHSAFGSGKLDNAQCLRFPQLAPAIVNPDRVGDEKAVFLVNRFAPQQMAGSMPLRAILVPRISGLPDTRVAPGSAMVALAALAPSTIFQLPGEPGAELSAMAELVRSVPVFVLELGTDFAQIPERIDGLVRSLAGATGDR
ncbi:MAG TPA: hypothetical protein VGN48_03805 [Pedococcus sp.]|nr:hypothetical protein [Pedococcus sp.]